MSVAAIYICSPSYHQHTFSIDSSDRNRKFICWVWSFIILNVSLAFEKEKQSVIFIIGFYNQLPGRWLCGST